MNTSPRYATPNAFCDSLLDRGGGAGVLSPPPIAGEEEPARHDVGGPAKMAQRAENLPARRCAIVGVNAQVGAGMEAAAHRRTAMPYRPPRSCRLDRKDEGA